MHTTNYTNTLIEVSEDCRARAGTLPPKPGSIAALQYDLLARAPYARTSDDLLVDVTALRQNLPEDAKPALRVTLFSKGQPCLRASPLVKSYGWGVHHDAKGRVALVSRDSPDYARLRDDPTVAKTQGMRSTRKG